MNIDQLVASVPRYLVRRSDKPTDRTFNRAGILREDAIPFSEVVDMSLNLLGGEFIADHIKYVQKSKGMKPWPGGPVFFIDHLSNFEVLEICCPIYFSIESLHKISFPFSRENDKEAKKLLREIQPAIVSLPPGKTIEFNATSEIVHTPNNLNYWHIELTFKDPRGNRVKNSSKAWVQSVATQFRQHIITGSAFYEFQERPAVEMITGEFFISSRLKKAANG